MISGLFLFFHYLSSSIKATFSASVDAKVRVCAWEGDEGGGGEGYVAAFAILCEGR